MNLQNALKRSRSDLNAAAINSVSCYPTVNVSLVITYLHLVALYGSDQM